MTLEGGFDGVLELLDRFQCFPKYALERRIDIFIAAFLEPYLAHKFGATVRHVAPEFPLRRPNDNRSTNVDYLLLRGGEKPAWIFVELKTTSSSYDARQLKTYQAARSRGMQELVADIETRIGPASLQRDKYRHLVAEIRAAGPVSLPVELVYLVPSVPLVAATDVLWITLDEFASWESSVHPDLWMKLRSLLFKTGPLARTVPAPRAAANASPRTQEPPAQPDALDKVVLHRKKDRMHELEEDVARELAHDIDRCVIAMEGMTVTLHKPLRDRSEQIALARRFLVLTSTPDGWWQEAIQSGEPRNEYWKMKARQWLADRRLGRQQRTEQ